MRCLLGELFEANQAYSGLVREMSDPKIIRHRQYKSRNRGIAMFRMVVDCEEYAS